MSKYDKIFRRPDGSEKKVGGYKYKSPHASIAPQTR